MAGQRSQIKEDVHFRVLRLLQDNPEMSQRELADAVGISVGGAHYALSALLERGLIKLGNFTAAKDKRRYAYVLTPKGISRKSALTRAFFARKVAEYEALKQEINKKKPLSDYLTLKEIDFKTMQSKIRPGIFFAGELLDVDGITGGFNFQNAWTTGWVAAQAMVDLNAKAPA